MASNGDVPKNDAVTNGVPNKSRKGKKKKSKPTAPKIEDNTAASNGTAPVQENGMEDVEDEDDVDADVPQAADDVERATQFANHPGPDQDREEGDGDSGRRKDDTQPLVNGHQNPEDGPLAEDTERRLEAAARERDELRVEVTELRQSLEQLKERHESEIGLVTSKLQQTEAGKEHAESQYQKLLGRVNTIKAQLGERLKADAEDLAQARNEIDELEGKNKSIQAEQDSLKQQLTSLKAEKEERDKELSGLRDSKNLSQRNWAKERDDMITENAQIREEYEAAKQAMQDWEQLAIEERSVRQGLGERVSELEEQLESQIEVSKRASLERDSQAQTVEGLQRALKEVQEARKTELRELVENSHAQLEELRRQLKIAEESSSGAHTELEITKKELERVMPFEKEIKEKNLLIGKLRQEAVILNDHLTKALRFLKKGKPQDNVDRQLVTNHFIHFLTLDRSDPKKFQVLQLIAALLSWTDEEKESAGLSRPGGSSSAATTNSLRVAISPFRRVSSSTSLNPATPLNTLFTPSTPSLGPEIPADSPSGKESLAELWSGFLEREAQEGFSQGSHSRKPSSHTGPISPPLSRKEALKSPSLSSAT